jgi:hypothetical protein
VGIKGPSSDAVQYVSSNNGNDTNDGLSPGTAKLTIAAAITALNAGVTGGGVVHLGAGVFAGGVTVPSGVLIIGAGKGATEVTAPNGAAAFDFPAGTFYAHIEDLWIGVTHATSTGITIEGSSTGPLPSEFNVIRNVRIAGDRTVGEHGINAQSSPGGYIALNRFDSVEIAQVDIPVICHNCEGNTWTDTQIIEYNHAGVSGHIAFDATGALNQYVQLRVTADNLAIASTAYFTDSIRNHAQVYCETAAAIVQTCVKDTGTQNLYLVTFGANSTSGTSASQALSNFCATSQKTETAADANVLTCTIPNVAGTYRIQFAMLVSAINTASVGWTLAWTDSGGNVQGPANMPLFQVGTAAPALTFSSVADYYGSAVVDSNFPGTSIVVKFTFSGTSVTAKVSATVERII